MHDYATANTINDMFRGLFSVLDRAAYWLLGIMYEILFNVASADLFANETIQKFYGRVQLIIGVFMIFKLAVSIIKGIINPDSFTDKKAGFSNMITRIIFALVLLTVLTPINIPNANSEYEIQINNNGLLFGTLYSLQNRILQNNTLGRLILGTNDGSLSTSTNNNLTGADKQAAKLKQSANIFTSTILKGFIRINLKDDGTDETNPEHRVCDYIEQDVLDAYTAYDASPNQILSLVNASCESQGGGFFERMAGKFKRLFSGDRYVFAYIPILPTIAAAIFIYILLGEIITIAIRSVKLAVLRLLAPIPIISYIDPKSEKDGAFGAWVKTLTSTYLELFIHLGVIYFVLFLIQDMIVNGVVINTGTGVIGVISCIFIWVGLFFFIRQAPKFIKDVLGVKGSSANIGLAGLLGGTAMALGGGGLKGFALGAMQGTDSATQGFNQGKAVPLGAVWNQNSDLMAKIRTGDKDAHGGIFGRTQDWLNYGVRENNAYKLGVGRNQLAALDYEKAVLEKQAKAAENEMKIAEMKYNTAPEAEKTARLNEFISARARYEAIDKKYKKAASAASTTEKQRDILQVSPRVIDTRKATYRSGSSVITDDDKIALDESRRQILEKDPSGHDIPGKPGIQETQYRDKYTFEADIKEFDGTIDDEVHRAH